MRKQRIDLKGSDQPAPHPLFRRQRGDVLIAEKDAAGIRAEHAGHQIDQRGFAGAVGADQRVADPHRQVDLDVGGDDQRPEAFIDAARGEGAFAHGAAFMRKALARCSNSENPPIMPSGRNITTAISNRPIQKYQNCGLSPENWSRATI